MAKPPDLESASLDGRARVDEALCRKVVVKASRCTGGIQEWLTSIKLDPGDESGGASQGL